MKLKLKIKNFTGQTKVLEQETRALDHLKAQMKFKSVKFENKRKCIPRKAKYKQITY